MKTLRIAQLSDCHLFSSINGLHYGANVYQNLCQVLNDIASDSSLDFVIFTGDLTQDHTIESYQLFMQAVAESALAIPLYFLSGNHDDTHMMEQVLMAPVSSNCLDAQLPKIYCSNDKVITSEHWQIALLNSKSDTPAGIVDEASLDCIHSLSASSKHTLLCMHHHPIDVGFGIDKHGLINKAAFWQSVEHNTTVKGVLCGHVHNAFHIEKAMPLPIDKVTNKGKAEQRAVSLYTCPATSVEFNTEFDITQKEKDNEESNLLNESNKGHKIVTKKGAGYQIISLSPEGSISRVLKYFPPNFSHDCAHGH